MKVSDVSVLNSKVYILLHGKAYVYGKAFAREFANCNVRKLHVEYNKVYIEVE